MKNLNLTLNDVEELDRTQMENIIGGAQILHQTIYQEGCYKPIWYDTGLDRWCTNSDMWTGLA